VPQLDSNSKSDLPMKKLPFLASFFALLLFFQVVVWSCTCSSYGYRYHYVPGRFDFYANADAAEKDSLNVVDWVRREKQLTGDKVQVAFVMEYDMAEVSGYHEGNSLVNTAYAECLPEFYYPADTILDIQLITTHDLGVTSSGQDILPNVGWTAERKDSLLEQLNFGFFPQNPTLRFSLNQKPAIGKVQLRAVVKTARRVLPRELYSVEMYWD